MLTCSDIPKLTCSCTPLPQDNKTHKNLPSLPVLEPLPGQSYTVVVYTLLWLIMQIPAVIKKTFSYPPLVRFYFHDITWTEAFHGLIKSASFMTVGSMQPLQYPLWMFNNGLFSVENLAHPLLISSRMFGCNFISLLPSVATLPVYSFVFSSGWLSSFWMANFTKGERRQVFNRMLPTPHLYPL